MRRYKETESDYIKSSIEKYMQQTVCPLCNGARLKKEATSITIEGKPINEVSDMTITEALAWGAHLNSGHILNGREKEIAIMVLKEIVTRLTFLSDVGLDYLTLSRGADTLSGGEAQRIRLASQIGSGLTGVLYVLDEPTIGLHPRDNDKLIQTLKKLRDLGNTVIVVEHDRDVMLAADYIFDFGPEAGKHGGMCIAYGTSKELTQDKNSVTGPYLSGKKDIVFAMTPQAEKKGDLVLKNAHGFNLKNVDLRVPLGKFVTVTGVSGSGKSSLVVETLFHAVSKKVNREHREEGLPYGEVLGTDALDKIIMIDQSPIGRTPRSNPATYTKVFDIIRDVYATTREAKVLGFKKGRFSFNVKGGRCESCEGS